ncbi:MAG: hypothetical protein ACE5OT_01315 [Candidatus Hadarchaeaceae archaeon]
MKIEGISSVAIVIIVAIIAAVAAGGLFFLIRPAPEVGPPEGEENMPGEGEAPPAKEITAIFTGSTYQSVTRKPTGWFTTGQEADIVLGLTDFGKAEPTLFNHPMKVATDGTRLVLADTWNNRVLIWNSMPTENNQPPDLVIGQENLYSNTPGLAQDKLNWPVGVATDGQRLVVADTLNDRILIWNEFPTQDGEPADLVLGAPDFTTRPSRVLPQGTGNKEAIKWPWDVFTDGTRLIVVNTGAARVSIWNQFPTQNNQPADVVLTSAVGLVTPRGVGFDGQHLLIGDYNAEKTFVWNQLPQSDDEPYNFVLWHEGPDPHQLHAWAISIVKGKLLALVGNSVLIWNEFPTSESDGPDVIVSSHAGFPMAASHGGIAATTDHLIVSEFNNNRIIIFNGIPSSSDVMPDVVLGAPNFETNTLLENYNVIQNAAVFSDGEHLFIGSDFDRRFSIWKNLPDQSVAVPDIVYGIAGAGATVYGNKLVVTESGGRVFIWNNIPLAGEKADIVIGPQLGNGMRLARTWGAAADANYLFVSDWEQNKIFVWQGGIPGTARSPDFTIDVDKPFQLSTDGRHLAVASLETGVFIWDLPLDEADLDPDVELLNSQMGFNLPQGVFIDGQHLFVADTSNNRVLIWNSIPTSGRESPDIVLGQQNFDDTFAHTTKDGLYMPGTVSFDGSYLWVGEFKFSNRVLRFSVH